MLLVEVVLSITSDEYLFRYKLDSSRISLGLVFVWFWFPAKYLIIGWGEKIELVKI